MEIETKTTEDKDLNSNTTSSLGEIVRFALITLIIVIPIRAYVAQPFIVSGTSMVPTFENGEYLIIDELSYHFRSPVRGEVVVFRFPEDPSKFFIKRVIGLPGETVITKDRSVSLLKDGETISLDESYIKESLPYPSIRMELSDDEYFVLGDNRDVSSDSRIWGPVEDHLIKGRVLLRLLPIGHFGFRPGDASSDFNQL